MPPETTNVRSVRERVLCVDDEQAVVDGIALHLRKDYDVRTATSPAGAIAKLRTEGPFAVVLSDMRMPQIDGTTMLSRMREAAPDTVRMLLTGHADLDAAVGAVNEAQVFRFLTKPCRPEVLREAFDAACVQYRLVTAQRVLLEDTLKGAVQALADVLALVSPEVFGRATRIQASVREIARKLEVRDTWHLDIAAILLHLGHVALPQELVAKMHLGVALSPEEKRLVDEAPALSRRMVERIPRLEPVLVLMDEVVKGSAELAGGTMVGGILKLAIDFDALVTGGATVPIALATLGERAEAYGREVYGAFASLQNESWRCQRIQDLRAEDLRVGMLFAEDARLTGGSLLAARGYQVSESFLARLRNYRPGLIKEPLRMLVAVPAEEAAA